MLTSSDSVVRAMTGDGAFRILTAVTTETVRGAARSQDASGVLAGHLGELVTGAVLVRETVSPDRRAQIVVRDGQGRSRMVADAHPAGWNRGIVNPGSADQAGVEAHAVLEVIYTLPNDVLQQGIVALPEGGDISAGLMTYMQESEQIVSMIKVRTIVDADCEAGIRAAGGYMVQLMPDAPRESLADMIERLEAFSGLDPLLDAPELTADGLRQALLGDLVAAQMATTYLSFGCNCDRDRVLAGLGSLPDADLREMIDDGEDLDIRCDACGKHYMVTPAELKTLMSSRAGAQEPRDRHN